MLSARESRAPSAVNPKTRQSRNLKHPFFSHKRPLLFQVRKSLVEYVDEELLKMDTSVFYQRIFILAKNVEPARESTIQSAEKLKRASTATAASTVEGGDTAAMIDEADEHYSQQSSSDEAEVHIKVVDINDVEKETITGTFRFDDDQEVQANSEEDELEKQDSEPEEPEKPKDIFAQFSDKLVDLHKRCRTLSYSPDPMCGLVIYMNEYTMMMLESGEDMMGIFCNELLKFVDEYWQSNRVFLMEDHITELYTKDLLFRRHPAVFLNEKFPTSTPTDEYLMGKQHLIIKDKMSKICGLIRDSMAPPQRTTEAVRFTSSGLSEMEELEGGESYGEDEDDQRLNRPSGKDHRLTVTVSETLPPEIFRKLLPEIQRIELVLSATRFYYTLEEFDRLYGNVPFAPDDDGLFWPIQNNYVPPNIFKRTQYDINLTFADYAADMKRRLQEEQDKNREELEAAAAAADAAAAGQSQPQPRQSKPAEEEQEAND